MCWHDAIDLFVDGAIAHKNKERAIALLSARAIAHEKKERARSLLDSYASRPSCNHRPLKGWKWSGLSVEREVG
ncbi:MULTISPECIES: hypothetical protein [unclassified Microcoleus]|uniref:hypothetical protein n=1 Tax=unclassified Microcoleus TaxID=2642155 RepID=UPI002FD24F71